MVPLLDLRRQWEELGEELEGALLRVARSGRFVMGPELESFERELAQFVGARYGVGVNSGTDALILALKALGVGPGDEVVIPAFTFFATAEAPLHLGASLRLADVDPETLNLSAETLERALSPKTKAVVFVHLYGSTKGIEDVRRLCQEKGLVLIEDAAQAIGARSAEGPAGSLGHAAAFSFYPTKNLSAMGDGGAITTNDPQVARRAKRLRDHGSEGKYNHVEVGYNSRLDEIQAAVLRVKLGRLERWNARRREIARRYSETLGDFVKIPPNDPGHVYHQYTIRTPKRDALARHLKERGIGFAVHYPRPLHLQPALAHLGYKEGNFPNAERAAREVLSLPIFPELTDREVEEVIEGVVSFFK